MNRRSNRRVARRPASPLRVAVVVSRYNESITRRRLEGATRRCKALTGGVPVVYDAPGAFELPLIARAAAESGAFDAVVALGCIIKGETSHDVHIAGAVARGLMDAALLTGVPVAFGVLTVDTPAQAEARAGGRVGNKGEEAMEAAIETALSVRSALVGGPAPARTGSAGPPRDKVSAARKRKVHR